MFESFPKIPRYNRKIIITEKIDGTNAQIYIRQGPLILDKYEKYVIKKINYHDIFAGSRNRFITPEDDNYGFASWVKENSEDLFKLGAGRHFGEWWGSGIQRGYGLKEKRFSLFNSKRWGYNNPNTPNCCSVVPIIAEGIFQENIVENCMELLKQNGSYAAPGYMNPEGIIIYHKDSDNLYKKTFEYDVRGKNSG